MLSNSTSLNHNRLLEALELMRLERDILSQSSICEVLVRPNITDRKSPNVRVGASRIWDPFSGYCHMLEPCARDKSWFSCIHNYNLIWCWSEIISRQSVTSEDLKARRIQAFSSFCTKALLQDHKGAVSTTDPSFLDIWLMLQSARTTQL